MYTVTYVSVLVGRFHVRYLVAHCRGSTVEQSAGPPSGTSQTPPAIMANFDSTSPQLITRWMTYQLVSAEIFNVCITRHAALNAIAYIICVKQFVMSLPAISLRYWFSGSRKGGTGGGGLV